MGDISQVRNSSRGAMAERKSGKGSVEDEKNHLFIDKKNSRTLKSFFSYCEHFLFRYEYDDHYFLTDPKEFIYEFFPLQSEWQLLKDPITLEEFEELPFVRSLFFRYQLSFPSDNMKSVMFTDSTGEARFGVSVVVAPGLAILVASAFPAHHTYLDLFFYPGAATIRLEMPGHMQNSLIFHYNLKFYGDDKDNYEGVSLKRFVMQVSNDGAENIDGKADFD